MDTSYMDDSFILEFGTEDNPEHNSTTKEKITEEVKSLEEAINHLERNEDPSNLDIAKAMVTMMKASKTSLAEHDAFKRQLNSVTKKTVENAISIKNMQKDFSKDVVHLNAKINQLEQQRLDDEVFIAGFPTKPDPTVATDALCNLFNISPLSISKKYAYEFKNRTKNSRESHLVIKFNSKAEHINFNKAKLKHGPVFVDQLIGQTGTSSNSNERQQLIILNRLSVVNRNIISTLRNLQREGKIPKDGIRYRNCFFEVKTVGSEEFVAITSMEHLNSIISFLN